MERKNNFSPDEDRDETLVTPRFDRDEAETARPVVPLAVVSGEADTYDPPAAHHAPRVMSRRSWPLALILVSALAGSVLGGAGLYLFQKSRQDGAAAAAVEQTTAAAAEQANAPAAETAPEPSPTPAEGAAALPVELTEQVAELPVAVEETEDNADAKSEESKRDEGDAAPAPREKSSPAEAPVKRGKKGDRDEEDNRGRESRPRRVADEYPRDSPSDDDGEDDYNDRREARRVGSIVYGGEGRRERRRQRRQPGVDRVRGIFEGQP